MTDLKKGGASATITNKPAVTIQNGGEPAKVVGGEGAEPANIPAATGFSPSGAPLQTVPDVDASHPAVDADPRAGTSVEQNAIDFNDPRKPGHEVVAEQLGYEKAKSEDEA